MDLAVSVTHRHVRCPTCAEVDSRVDHLLNHEVTWICKSCGSGYSLKMVKGELVSVTPVFGHKRIKTWDLVRTDQNIFFILDSSRYEFGKSETEEEVHRHKTYFVDEHTCPSNLFREVEAVIYNGNDDPHGLLKFVRSVDADTTDPDPDFEAMFPEAYL